MTDPTALRAAADDAVAEAKRIHAELDAEDCDLTAEQRDKRESRVETLLDDAKAKRAQADDLDRLDAHAGDRDRHNGKRPATSVGRASTPPTPDAFRAGRPNTLKAWMSASAEAQDTGGFDSLGEFLTSVREQRTGRAVDERLQYMAAGQSGASDPAGGFLLPDYFQRELIQTSLAMQPWLSQLNVFVLPDGQGRQVVTPMLADRDKSGKDVGGVALTRIGETGTIPLSTMAFKSRTATLGKAGTRVRMSNELLADSAVGVDAAVRNVFAQAVTIRQATDVLSGTGAGVPTGIVGSSATYEVAKESGQTADTINGTNLLKMRQRAADYGSCVWLLHQSAYLQVLNAHSALTNSDYPLFIHGNGTDVPDTLLGRPVYFTEAAQLPGDKGDVILANLAQYVYIVKPLRIDLSSDFRFDTDEVEYRIVLRDSGAPLHSSTRSDLRGYETSEFVTLAERA